MRVLVTGGTGFTGSHLVRKLAALGNDVRVLVRDGTAPDVPGVEPIHGDIADPAAVDSGMAGVTTVYHVAAVFRTAGVDDRVYHDVHVKGTENVMEAALRHGVSRVVHCSTVGVHGHIEDPPADETYRFSPGDIYQRTKLEGEELAWRYHRERGLPVSVVRPTPIYGPGDMRLLKLFRLACRGRPVILGSGEIFYHMVHVDDLVQGFLLAGEKAAAVGEAFIIGGAECLTLLALIDLIREVLGLPRATAIRLPALPVQIAGSLLERLCIPLGVEPPIYRRRVDFFTKSRSFSIAKAQRLLGYQPQVGLREGLGETGRGYRHHGQL